PEYLRRTLAIDINLIRLLDDPLSVLSARGIDPESAEGKALLGAVKELENELNKPQRDSTLEIEYHKVHARENGKVKVGRFNLNPVEPAGRLPVDFDNIGGITREPSIGSRPDLPPDESAPDRDRTEDESGVSEDLAGQPLRDDDPRPIGDGGDALADAIARRDELSGRIAEIARGLHTDIDPGAWEPDRIEATIRDLTGRDLDPEDSRRVDTLTELMPQLLRVDEQVRLFADRVEYDRL